MSNLEPGDVLFIDEIHRMPKYIEEILYPAMEDFELDIVINNDGHSRNIKIDLPPFTLVGATTRAGDISAPLRDRFGIVSKLNYYNENELIQIVKRTSRVLKMDPTGPPLNFKIIAFKYSISMASNPFSSTFNLFKESIVVS